MSSLGGLGLDIIMFSNKEREKRVIWNENEQINGHSEQNIKRMKAQQKSKNQFFFKLFKSNIYKDS